MVEINRMLAKGQLQDVLSLIISDHIDINTRDSYGRTLLFYCLTGKHKDGAEIAKYLIKNKANLRINTQKYFDPPFRETPYKTFQENVENFSEKDLVDIFILILKYGNLEVSYKKNLHKTLKIIFEFQDFKQIISKLNLS